MSKKKGTDRVEDTSGSDEEKGISPPPISLPIPDKFDTSSTDTAVKRADARARVKAEKKRKKNKGRKHPTDGYAPLKKKGGNGCLGCIGLSLFLLLLVVGGGIGYFIWWGIAPYKQAGYEIVRNDNAQELLVVEAAPDVETLYLNVNVEYRAENTPKKIVFVGRNVTISGVFEEKVTFKGWTLTIEEGTVFKSDLEVYAFKMEDNGSTCEGELTGSVLRQ